MTRRAFALAAFSAAASLAALFVPPQAGAAGCSPRPLDAARLAAVASVFEARRPALEAMVGGATAGFTPSRLYELQMATAPLLQWAAWHGQRPMVEKLAALYDRARDNLALQSTYMFFFVCDGGNCPRQTDRPIAPARLWTYEPLPGSTARYEDVLHSAQFGYAVARILSYTAATPRADRGDALPAFASRWLPVLLDDHYLRWVFGRAGEPGVWERAGWGCGLGNFTAEAHWKNLADAVYGTPKLPRARAIGYCNAVTDDVMWIVAGVAELLMAHKADARLVPMADAARVRLETFVRQAVATMAARTSVTRLAGEGGRPAEGRLFDVGAFDTYPDHAYAGDEDPAFPGWNKAGESAARPPRPGHGTAWDISHARRLVNVLDTLRRATGVLGTAWPTREDMAGFARQFAYVVARPDADGRMRFTNFFDGSNGWYRVNYSNRPGFGYPPFGLSREAPHSGYGFWGAYAPRALAVVRQYVEQNPVPAEQRIMVEPGLEAVDSEPQACPPGQVASP